MMKDLHGQIRCLPLGSLIEIGWKCNSSCSGSVEVADDVDSSGPLSIFLKYLSFKVFLISAGQGLRHNLI